MRDVIKCKVFFALKINTENGAKENEKLARENWKITVKFYLRSRA